MRVAFTSGRRPRRVPRPTASVAYQIMTIVEPKLHLVIILLSFLNAQVAAASCIMFLTLPPPPPVCQEAVQRAKRMLGPTKLVLWYQP